MQQSTSAWRPANPARQQSGPPNRPFANVPGTQRPTRNLKRRIFRRSPLSFLVVHSVLSSQTWGKANNLIYAVSREVASHTCRPRSTHWRKQLQLKEQRFELKLYKNLTRCSHSTTRPGMMWRRFQSSCLFMSASPSIFSRAPIDCCKHIEHRSWAELVNKDFLFCGWKGQFYRLVCPHQEQES